MIVDDSNLFQDRSVADHVKLAIQKLAPNVSLECVRMKMNVQKTLTSVTIYQIQNVLTFQINQALVSPSLGLQGHQK